MRILDKYIMRGFLGPYIWCMLLFTIMAVIIDVFSFIDDIVKYKIPAESLIAFYVYYCPTIIVQVMPMAVLLSTIYLLSNLNKHNEIIAMKSGGVSLWRAMAPILVMGLIISAMVFIINDRIIPTSSKVSNMIRREELESMKADNVKTKILENVAIYGTENRIIFAKNYDVEKATLNEIIIHRHDTKQNLISKVTAEKAVWTGSEWKLYRAIVYRIDNAGRILGRPQFFNETNIALNEKPKDFATSEWRAEYMSYKELRGYINKFKGAGRRLMRTLLVELNYKISFCFISLIIIVVGAPFALISTRGGVLIGIGMSVAIGLLYYASIAIFLAFGKGGLLPPTLAAWLGNILFAWIGIRFVNKRA